MSEMVQRIRRDPTSLEAISCPVLVWSAPASANDSEHWERTRGHNVAKPIAGDPRVFRVEKGAKANNAFAFGITVGRVDTNDLVLEDDSISRFHAFLKLDERNQMWMLTDAESKNGTWVDGKRLEKNQRIALRDNVSVKFGDAEMRFLMPATLKALINSEP